jgi:cytochrome c
MGVAYASICDPRTYRFPTPDMKMSAPFFRSFQMIRRTSAFTTAALALALSALAPAQAAVDADGAKALFKDNECTKCHAPDKSKKGPSLKKIAEKYKGKAEGQDKLVTNFTTGPKVKLDDGTEEKHKVIDTKDPKALKNLADWILAQ